MTLIYLSILFIFYYILLSIIRKMFYRILDVETKVISEDIDEKETMEFWQGLCKSEDSETNHDDLINTLEPIQIWIDNNNEDETKEFIEQSIKYLPNWKTPGHDHVHNFFIKKIHALHDKIKEIICEIISNPEIIDEEFYIGTTYLIPKVNNASQPNELRPITCLPNLYKLVSKVIASILARICDVNNIISINQMSTRRACQGAKQQALINKNINIKYNNSLATSWIHWRKWASKQITKNQQVMLNLKTCLDK